jgi:uncharacterized protein (DUF488 family)
MMIPVYTIGYGSRSIDEFIATLQRYAIEYLVDVRSAPYSRFKPEYSQDALESTLRAHGVRYLFLGDVLGGRPADPACYTDGKADYAKMQAQPSYVAGVARVHEAFRQQRRVVLMCSEGKPVQCHRSKLIGASLVALNVEVAHIDEEGNLVTQEEVVAELTRGQLSLFGEPTFTSRKRYYPTAASEHDGEDDSNKNSEDDGSQLIDPDAAVR